MKTKELIRKLQEADPTGEEECVIGNQDILYVERLPAYYDGPCQRLIRDGNNITGVEIRISGFKVSIVSHGVDDVFLDDPDTPVTYDSDCPDHIKAWVEEQRAKMREIIEKVDNESSPRQ